MYRKKVAHVIDGSVVAANLKPSDDTMAGRETTDQPLSDLSSSGSDCRWQIKN
jgi:hypothetical protein